MKQWPCVSKYRLFDIAWFLGKIWVRYFGELLHFHTKWFIPKWNKLEQVFGSGYEKGSFSVGRMLGQAPTNTSLREDSLKGSKLAVTIPKRPGRGHTEHSLPCFLLLPNLSRMEHGVRMQCILTCNPTERCSEGECPVLFPPKNSPGSIPKVSLLECEQLLHSFLYY